MSTLYIWSDMYFFKKNLIFQPKYMVWVSPASGTQKSINMQRLE